MTRKVDSMRIRDAAIHKMRDAGASLIEIGRTFNITRERVRVIIRRDTQRSHRRGEHGAPNKDCYGCRYELFGESAPTTIRNRA